MLNKIWKLRVATAGLLIAAFWMTSIPIAAQDLVAVSSISGSSSIFVFRSSSRSSSKRVAVRPTRSKEAQMASAAKIKKQYLTLAKTTPKPNRAKIVDPTKLGPNPGKSLPPAQASKLFTGVGEYYVEKGDYDQSFDFFREAVRLDDKNVTARTGYSEALALKGNELLAKDQGDSAKGMFLEALKFDPKNAAAYFGLGEVYNSLDQQSEAIAAYEKSLSADKNLTEIYVPLGILYFQAGDIAKADELLSKALAISATNAETQFFLGLIRTSQNRIDEALAAFQKAKTLDTTYAEAYYNAGELLVKLKRPKEAIPEYLMAVKLRPSYFDAMVGLGAALFETGNYPEAVNAYNSAVKLRNDNWEAFAGLAEAYRMAQDYNNAEANYRLAALFYTRTKDFNKDVAADLYSKQGFVIGQQCPINQSKFVVCRWPVAVKAMEEAVRIGNNPIDYANLGWVYYNAARVDLDNKDLVAGKAKLEMAKTALLKAIAESPAVADGALQNLGAVQLDQGDFAGAVTSLLRIVDKHPEWSFSRYALGTAYYKTNDFENAAKWFRAVTDKEPNYVPALASLGYALIKLRKGNDVKKIIDRLKPLNALEALKLEKEMNIAKL